MFSTVLSATLQGLRVEFIQVEADVSNGLPMFQLVGYLSSEVKEAGERVRVAIRNSDFALPPKKIVVNLSPADIKKRGSIFDLAIAVAVLSANGEIPHKHLRDTIILGELSLDGAVKKVTGILPIIMESKQKGIRRCIVPKGNQHEADLIEGIEIIGVDNLIETKEILTGKRAVVLREKRNLSFLSVEQYPDFSDIKGQQHVKRAVEIAVAGGHNILMIGPPGAGKTAIAKCIPGILPPLSLEESIELTTIYSIIGEVEEECPLKTERPFREVNSTITQTGLLGGGVYPRPGEISLAHKGVLFLDEIAEFPRTVLESLRRPIEDHTMKIIREKGEYEFPAEFLLVAAMNPCPCGNYPDLNTCTCTTPQIQSYLGKLSQPFLDRIDICIEVPKVQYNDLTEKGKEESSEKIRERIAVAREIQRERYRCSGIYTNAQLGVRENEEYCALEQAEQEIMKKAYDCLGLTARTYHKVLHVARTIADLGGCAKIEGKHLREALSYRTMHVKCGR